MDRRDIYGEDALMVYRNLGYMHPDVFRYIVVGRQRRANFYPSREIGWRQIGKTTGRCIDAGFSVLKDEYVLYIVQNHRMKRSIETYFKSILLRGFKMYAHDIVKVCEKINFMTVLDFQRLNLNTIIKPGIPRLDVANKIILDID